ncbi:DUF2891 domain-containing protein [Belliella kenyensis]|uniref:DUF2891 domain-containing protein n=1 Tax=Belliella kenyensis TaxID=1472724 RepID=A0ABV8EKK6_9BACT|nr:DUF2891 domain-containing protein [Belliella kenyensis]MCH7400491.1 DUF2891 domain-containing protein [Belliella kenyensis]MDN3604493.1 DUF2891 domain-containing protein [Belliella kenyensis]
MSNHDSSEEMISLTLEEANRLSKLPLQCIQEEYPNKLNQTLASKQYLKSPSELHPAFYGCFDWHSSVHGHWMLISLLNDFPDLDQRSEIITKLKMNMSYTNILAEVNYFFQPQNESFERTYGWAWVLKLAEELHRWDDPIARELEKNLQPLTDLIVKKYLEFLPKLIYPIRVGEHTNIAFGLSLAYDYAVTLNEKELAEMIRSRSRDWFLEDKGCPMNWEPSGYDFLSPCFQEIDIMRKVLEPEEFGSWIEEFMPELKEKSYTLTPGQVSDRTDGKLVHLDGLNFSRAWCIYGLASAYPDKYSHLIRIANEHVNYSLPSIVDDNYEGTHWLGSFAVYALQQKNQ